MVKRRLSARPSLTLAVVGSYENGILVHRQQRGLWPHRPLPFWLLEERSFRRGPALADVLGDESEVVGGLGLDLAAGDVGGGLSGYLWSEIKDRI